MHSAVHQPFYISIYTEEGWDGVLLVMQTEGITKKNVHCLRIQLFILAKTTDIEPIYTAQPVI